jgi:hypothetical protein
VICALVAMGLLLCAGKESQAKQPARAPEPADPRPLSARPAAGRRARRMPAVERLGQSQDLVL